MSVGKMTVQTSKLLYFLQILRDPSSKKFKLSFEDTRYEIIGIYSDNRKIEYHSTIDRSWTTKFVKFEIYIVVGCSQDP